MVISEVKDTLFPERDKKSGRNHIARTPLNSFSRICSTKIYYSYKEFLSFFRPEFSGNHFSHFQCMPLFFFSSFIKFRRQHFGIGYAQRETVRRNITYDLVDLGSQLFQLFLHGIMGKYEAKHRLLLADEPQQTVLAATFRIVIEEKA